MPAAIEPTQSQPAGITRRDILLGLGAVAAAASMGSAHAQEGEHDHSKHRVQQPELLTAVNACLDAGRRCIAHCLVTFREGDSKLADCAAKVHEMQAVCEAFAWLVAANSGYVKAYANICARVCSDCEDECRKHEQHIECHACAEACADLVQQIGVSV